MTQPFNVQQQPSPAASNPFLNGLKATPFSSSGFGKPSTSGFGKPSESSFGKPSQPAFGKPSQPAFGKPSQPSKQPKNNTGGETKRKGRGFGDKDASASESEASKRKSRDPKNAKKQNGPTKPLPNGTAPSKPFASKTERNHATGFGAAPSNSAHGSVPTELLNSADPHARKVYTQLQKDGIRPPTWPSEAGNPQNKAAMAKFRESYEDYRDKVRASLTKAGLIDDPNKRRRLDDAIEFRGICEDMCPEFEKITRITEVDVVQAEKNPNTGFPVTQKMVKKLARSAAGQEAPLPMDVRSIASLRRTLDYLIDDLLCDDDNLAGMHGFLWDRTRALRRDFTFFSSLKPDELKTQIYVLENIARFHVTSLHLLSNSSEDFVEQQEKEQLGKTLLTLRDLYDDCNVQNIKCDNEAEFRAYYLLFHAQDPNIMEVLQRQWKPWLWKDSDEIRTAVSLVEAFQNTTDFQGPLTLAPALAAAGPLHAYFRIVNDPTISYTMACFAEIHFAHVRRSVLTALVGAVARPKVETKDMTAGSLNEFLKFDTVDEAISFANEFEVEFEDDVEHPGEAQYSKLILQHKQQLPHIRLSHQFSQNIVERKRGDKSLPEVIHTTVPDTGQSSTANDLAREESLFVGSHQEPKSASSGALFGPSTLNGTGSVTQPPTTTPSTGFSFAPAPSGSQSTIGSIFSGPKPTTTSPFNPIPSTSAPSIFAQPKPDDSQKPFGLSNGSTEDTAKPSLFTNATTTKPTSSVGQLTTTPAATPGMSIFGNTTPSLFSSTPSAPAAPAPSQPGSTLFQSPESTPTSKGNPFPAPPTTLTSSLFQPQNPTPGATEPEPPQPSPAEPAQVSLKPPPMFTSTQPKNPSPLQKEFNVSPGPSLSTTPKAPVLGESALPPPATTSFFPDAQSKPPGPIKYQPPKPKDIMGDFTKWFLLGDNGLLEEFEKAVVEYYLEPLYTNLIEQERLQREKEEEEATNLKAEKWRVYNLRLKYFYRWKNNAREKRQRFLRRSGRDQMREFWRQAEQEKREKREREEEKKKKEAAAAASLPVDRPAEFREMVKRKRKSSRQAADELLASGILSGVANEREAIAGIVYSGGSVGSSVAGSIDSERTETSSKIAKREGSKTRALRESLLGRKSLPEVFTRRRSASPAPVPPRAATPTRSKVSERWRLKAMGFVKMPDGTLLNEEMADQYIYGGKKYPRNWAGSRSSSQDLQAMPPPGYNTSRHRSSSYSTPANGHHPTLSGDYPTHRASLEIPTKRKRDEADEIDDDTSTDTPPHKRTVSDLLEMTSKLRKDHKAIRDMLDDMLDEDKEYYREASREMGSEPPSGGDTPWRRSHGSGV